MRFFASPVPRRSQSLCAHSTLPCRHLVAHATPRPASSLPGSRRLLRLTFAALAAFAVSALAGAPLQAQSAHFGTVVTLGSGFATPTGVAVDASGNVYVADNGHSAVKQIVAVNGSIPASPVINTLGSGFSNPFTVAVDGNGNVFLTDYGHKQVKEIVAVNGVIPPSPTIRVLGGGFSFIFGSAVDTHGNVFVTDYGNNAVKEIVALNGTIPASPKILNLGGGFNIPAGVAVDANGNIFIGDQNNNAVKEILASSGYTSTILVASGFNTPDGVAVDQYGDVFVANDGGNAVNEILAVNGVIPPSPTVLTLGTGFLQPFDVAVDLNGNVYVADRGNNAVKEIQMGPVNFGPVNLGTSTAPMTLSFTFDSSTQLGSVRLVTMGNTGMDFSDAGGSTCVGGSGYSAGNVCTVNVGFAPIAPGTRYGAVELVDSNGAVLAVGRVVGVGVGPQVNFARSASGVLFPATAFPLGSGFNGPGGVAVDAAGNVFVGDSNNGAVREIMAAGGWTTVNTRGGGFSYPNGVALDGAGNIYVADTFHDAVKEIMAASGYTTVNTLGSGFSDPYGVAVDGQGNVFVADFTNGAVKEILARDGAIPASPSIRTLATGIAGPDGVVVDGNGNVFVAVYGDGTVIQIHAVNGFIPASPVITTIASGFEGPSNLALDGIGNVYVSDSGNNQVTEILAAGGYTKVRVLLNGFNFPEAVAVDANGRVIVADTGNNAVDLLDYADAPDLQFQSTPVGIASTDSPQTVTVTNQGNAPLIFPLPGAGHNPNVSPDFLWGNTSTCLQTAPASPQAFQLAADASCTMVFSFKPTIAGDLDESAVLTDNNLNLVNNKQTIQLIGTGITPVKADLNSPAPGSTLPGTSATFKWTAGVGVVKYQLKLGTTGPGSIDVYTPGSSTTALNSGVINNIPAFGQKLYARLYSYINGAWQYNDYTYIESGSPVKAVLTAPVPSSTLTGSSATFTWTAGGGVTKYLFRLGTTGPGSNDLYNPSNTSTTALTTGVVNNIPTLGVTIYARLHSFINGAWQYNDYTYTEFGAPVKAALTSPAPSSTLTGSSATFTWTAGSGVTKYLFRLGTTGPGSSDVYNASNTSTTTLTTGAVNNIPTNGATLYARLYSYINGAWQYNDYTYKEK